MSENRKYSRIGFKIDCRYKTGGREIPCRVLNLSLKGLLAEIEEELPVELYKGIIEMNLLNSDIVISFDSEIVHQSGNQFGFRFVSTDSESLTHLRSILEANTGNPDKIDDELHFLVENSEKQ